MQWQCQIKKEHRWIVRIVQHYTTIRRMPYAMAMRQVQEIVEAKEKNLQTVTTKKLTD